MVFGPCRFDSLSTYCVFIYHYFFISIFPIESEYDICFFLEKNIIKKLFNFIVYPYSILMKPKTFIIATYYMKRWITQPLGLSMVMSVLY